MSWHRTGTVAVTKGSKTVTGSVISGIPQGATVTLGEQSFAVDDGEADIEGYTGVVKIKCWPYLDAEVEI